MATTTTRATMIRQGGFIKLPVAATTKINGGSIVAINASGNAVPASADATLVVVGKADTAADNTSGAAGDLSVTIELSCGTKDFLYINSSGSVGADDLFKVCYIVDDQTVSMTSTDTIEAGTVMGLVSTTGVWVRFAL